MDDEVIQIITWHLAIEYFQVENFTRCTTLSPIWMMWHLDGNISLSYWTLLDKISRQMLSSKCHAHATSEKIKFFIHYALSSPIRHHLCHVISVNATSSPFRWFLPHEHLFSLHNHRLSSARIFNERKWPESKKRGTLTQFRKYRD